jgi:hypothetical protein
MQSLSEPSSSVNIPVSATGQRGSLLNKTRGRVPPPGMPWWWNNL